VPSPYLKPLGEVGRSAHPILTEASLPLAVFFLGMRSHVQVRTYPPRPKTETSAVWGSTPSPIRTYYEKFTATGPVWAGTHRTKCRSKSDKIPANQHNCRTRCNTSIAPLGGATREEYRQGNSTWRDDLSLSLAWQICRLYHLTNGERRIKQTRYFVYRSDDPKYSHSCCRGTVEAGGREHVSRI
jgi:hypothetical protein